MIFAVFSMVELALKILFLSDNLIQNPAFPLDFSSDSIKIQFLIFAVNMIFFVNTISDLNVIFKISA